MFGRCTIFLWQNQSEQSLPPPQKHDGDIRFGSSLDIKDDYLIIGAPEDNYVDETNTVIVDGGIVYSYKFSTPANKYGGFSSPDFVYDISMVIISCGI